MVASQLWGGEIYGEEIYGIYELDFDTVVGDDIVYMHEVNKKQNIYPSIRLRLQQNKIVPIFIINIVLETRKLFY